MRSYHYNATTSCVLLLWCLAVVFVLSLEATAVLAAPGSCANCGCSCTANMCCQGCQPSYDKPPGTTQITAGYLYVTYCSSSQYNVCNIDGSNSSCVQQQVSCFTIPDGAQVVTYTDENCTMKTQETGPLYVIVSGCTESGPCGGA